MINILIGVAMIFAILTFLVWSVGDHSWLQAAKFIAIIFVLGFVFITAVGFIVKGIKETVVTQINTVEK